eukprot:TRINITY_DN62379_c0_g1_i1.p2 TRINITY_DN62379_c0_g1~~TRINITY_DN62379_c0_g1_i1.p2  ORF type:complete len:574 (-),score=80.80 TRINITY_DN62379_c0_g1_i1:2285-4006(-)
MTSEEKYQPTPAPTTATTTSNALLPPAGGALAGSGVTAPTPILTNNNNTAAATTTTVTSTTTNNTKKSAGKSMFGAGATSNKTLLGVGRKVERDWIDKLDRILTQDGVAEYNARQIERDDSTTVSDSPGSPAARTRNTSTKQSEGTRDGTKTKRAALQSKEREKSVSRLFEKLGKLSGPERKMHKEVENLIAMQEKETKRLRKENEHLREIAMITQQNSLINEQRFADEITALESQLDSAVLARLDDGEKMNSLRLTNKQIQDEIANMRGIAENQAEVEKSNLIKAFTKQIEMKAVELEDERRSGQNTTGEWIAKNKELQDLLDDMLDGVEAKHDANKILLEKNKALQVEYKAQEDDHTLLQRELELARKRNISLKDRIHELESQITELQKNLHHDRSEKAEIEGAFMSTMHDAQTPNLTEKEKFNKYEDALSRIQKLSNMEKDNLRSVRDSHLKTLNTRTELEVLLRQAINDVKNTIVQQSMQSGDWSRSKAQNISLSEFTTADRRRVVEVVLSKDRVLELLYNEETQFHVGEAAPLDDDTGLAESTDRGEAADPALEAIQTKAYMDMYHSM